MTPFIDLLEQPDDITCGPTSVAMILRFYNKNVPISEVKKITRTVWYNHGGKDFGMTAPYMICKGLDYYGCKSKLGIGSLKKLKSVVSSGRPCIVLVRSGEYSWHYVVVTGYGNSIIFYANPTDASITGLSEQEFLRAWNWSGDLLGRDCGWWLSFWLRAIEIYPCSYVYVETI